METRRTVIFSYQRLKVSGIHLKACPELESFLSNIRKDVLDLTNIRKPKDKLSKEERKAI